MLRVVSAAIRGIAAHTSVVGKAIHPAAPSLNLIAKYNQHRCFGALSSIAQNSINFGSYHNKTLLGCPSIESSISLPLSPITTPVRTVTKFSLRKGKRKAVRAVIERFYRLNWGIWIRTKAGRHKHLWKKSGARRRRLRQHVFVNSTQSYLLDKMVTKFWRRPRFYVDDPYTPYQQREEHPCTRKLPKPLN